MLSDRCLQCVGGKNSTASVASYPALTFFLKKVFWFLIELVYRDTMSEVFISYEQAIDRALRKAYGILAIVAAPAYFLGGYRSLVVDYAPLHLTIISFVWLSFFALAMIRSEAVTLRYNFTIFNFLILFVTISFNNQSVMVSDVFLVIACAFIAIRHSIAIVFLVMLCFGSGVYLLIDEWAILPNTSHFLHITLHSASLCISFLLLVTIKNLVTNYKILYENQFSENSALVEEAKQSYLLVSEAEESKEFETLKLRAAAFSVYSQLKELRKIFQQRFKDRNSKIDELYSDGLAEIGEDLLLFKETGSYLSDGEQEITLNQVISIIDEYLKNSSTAKIELVFAPSTDVGSAQNLKFPLRHLKVMCHHIIGHIGVTVTNRAKFTFGLEAQTETAQQIVLDVHFTPLRDDLVTNISKLNKKLDTRLNLHRDDDHLDVIKLIIRRHSGQIAATKIGNSMRYTFKFWVRIASE